MVKWAQRNIYIFAFNNFIYICRTSGKWLMNAENGRDFFEKKNGNSRFVRYVRTYDNCLAISSFWFWFLFIILMKKFKLIILKSEWLNLKVPPIAPTLKVPSNCAETQNFQWKMFKKFNQLSLPFPSTRNWTDLLMTLK